MFLRSPAVRRWPWSTARSRRRKLAAGTAELRTPGCWPSPTSARRSGRTPPAGSAAWPEGWGWTPRTCPAPPRTARRSALLPCRRPARSVPRPSRGRKSLCFSPGLADSLRCSSAVASSRSLVAHLSSPDLSPHLRLINSHHLRIIAHQEARFG